VSAFTIDSVEALAEQKATVALALGGVEVGGRKAGVAAKVSVQTDGVLLTLGVSKLAGETEWTVDSLSQGGLPVFANGVGSRCTALKSVSDKNIVAALEAEAEAVIA
jgi:hypothetical protein